MSVVSTVTKAIPGSCWIAWCPRPPSRHRIVEDQPPSQPLDLGPTETRLGVATVPAGHVGGSEHSAQPHFGPDAGHELFPAP
jgi:hypothetical protein